MSAVPSIKVLEAIQPANAGTGQSALQYNQLPASSDYYFQSNAARETAAWQADEGTIEETAKARQLAFEYLVHTSLRTVESPATSRDLWADRFTQASVELYSAPDARESGELLRNEYNFLKQLRGNQSVQQEPVEFLLASYEPYKPLWSQAEGEQQADAELAEQAIQQFGEVVRERYQPLFDLVDAAGKDQFSPEGLLGTFTECIKWLAENDDPAWREWQVVMDNGTSIHVNATEKTLYIPANREHASRQETHNLVAHELIIHGLRIKNGFKTGVERLGKGLPGFLGFEEGLGIFIEHAVSGEVPPKAYDRYLDMALAMGVINGRQLTRAELTDISYARQHIRAELQNEPPVRMANLRGRVQAHVDRIYRGGKGDNMPEARQAIFTSDVSYYLGYKKAVDYISGQLLDGKSMPEIFDYIVQGRFDPTDAEHVSYLHEHLAA